MAYLDFREAELSGSLHSAFLPRTASIDEPAKGFSPLEWLVIAVAQRDSRASLREPSRLGRAIGALFGSRGGSRLASPRLEALRRLAVHAWHGGHNVPPSELAAFRTAGFSVDQADLLLESVVSGRAQKRARRAA